MVAAYFFIQKGRCDMQKEPTKETAAVLPEIKRRKRKAPDTKNAIANISYQSLLELYIRECTKKGLAEETIVGYKNATRYFLDFAGYDLMCNDVTQDLINEYYLYLQDHYKPQTVNSYVFKISPTVLYGVEKGYIKEKIEFTHCKEQLEIKEIYTVCKAYSSAVGAGAFVSEIFGEEADELRRRGGDGGEYGATTGRPRRMGWFDCVASKYGCRLQGTTDVFFTVLDVLGYLDEIPVCVGYEIDGEVTTDFPVTCKLEKAKPVLKTLPGWKTDIRGIKNYEDLPENCRKYVEFIEEQIGYPITLVSNGPSRDDIIYRKSPLKK